MIEKPIFLIRGMDWTPTSAGIRCLHTLCAMLLDQGEEAYLSACHLQNGSKARTLHPSVLDARRIVLIEPEIMEGKKHDWTHLEVRWLLNLPGKAGKDQSATWGKNDLLYHFDERFRFLDSHPLVVPHVDRTFFNNEHNNMDNKRDLDCFYARKAIHFGESRQCPDGAIDISPDQGHAGLGDWKQLATLFRRTKTLYVMEDTATAIEAALCGAKIKYIKNSYMPIPPAMNDLAEWYANLERRAGVEVDNFVNVCYMRLGMVRQKEYATT